jgi:hypothetical protein
MQSSAQLCPAIGDLPGRSDAEKALAAAYRDGRHSFFYAVALPVKRALDLLDQGDWQGADAVLLDSFLNLTRRVSVGDHLYRWSGAALLALVERHGPAETASRELQIQLGPRRVFRLTGEATLDRLCGQIDRHIATSL